MRKQACCSWWEVATKEKKARMSSDHVHIRGESGGRGWSTGSRVRYINHERVELFVELCRRLGLLGVFRLARSGRLGSNGPNPTFVALILAVAVLRCVN